MSLLSEHTTTAPRAISARPSADSSAFSSASSSPMSRPISPPTAAGVPSNVYQIPTTVFDANTGPKGVIADAQNFERARRRTFRQTLYGVGAAVGGNIISASDKLRSSSRRRGSGSDRSATGSSHGVPSVEVSGGEEDEDEFMKSWREKRMAEMREKRGDAPRPQHNSRRSSPSKRRWGSLRKVDAVGYLDAIEKVAADTMVVVMISDDESSLNSMVQNCLSNLARKHETTRFVSLDFEEAEMDAAACPAVLAYCDGELVANLVSIVDEIPEGRDLSVSSLEDVLKTHGVLA